MIAASIRDMGWLFCPNKMGDPRYAVIALRLAEDLQPLEICRKYISVSGFCQLAILQSPHVFLLGQRSNLSGLSPAVEVILLIY